jgi:PAS domain S-box-containing protein
MWKTDEESPLWGILPYRVAVPVLLILALTLTALLVFSLESWHSAVGDLLGSHPPGMLRSDLIKLAVIAVLLGGTAIVSLALLQHYRNTQHALWRVQELSRQILENMVSGIMTLDLKGDIAVANPTARAMLNLGPGNLHDLPWLFAKHHRLGELVQAALEREDYAQDVDLEHVSHASGKIWLRATTWPLVIERGTRVGVVVMLQDITRILAIEKQLRRLDVLAATETLAAGVAHEVRNPLTAIDLNLRLLRDEVAARLPGAADLKDYFDILTEETARLNRITEEFLAFARPGSAVHTALDVTDVVNRVVRLLEVEARERHIAFRVASAPDLAQICGDPERLEQVFLNILVNATEAMPRGGEIGITAANALASGRSLVEVTITDDGPGVSKDHLPRLFDPYFTTKPAGTGIGLSIVHRIVADHDGDITIENGAAGGLSVRIRLPAQEKETSQPLIPSGASHEPQSAHRR